MPFDLASARPVAAAPPPAAPGGFDLGSARPVRATEQDANPSAADTARGVMSDVASGRAGIGAGEMLLSAETGMAAQPIAGIGGLAAGATNYVNRLVGSDTP